MTNSTIVVDNQETKVLQEVRGRTVYLEARAGNTTYIGVANRDMPLATMKLLYPGQWFAISAEFSERFYFKAPSIVPQTVEWWYED